MDEERRQWELGMQNALIALDKTIEKSDKSMDAFNLMIDSLGITRAAANHPP